MSKCITTTLSNNKAYIVFSTFLWMCVAQTKTYSIQQITTLDCLAGIEMDVLNAVIVISNYCNQCTRRFISLSLWYQTGFRKKSVNLSHTNRASWRKGQVQCGVIAIKDTREKAAKWAFSRNTWIQIMSIDTKYLQSLDSRQPISSKLKPFYTTALAWPGAIVQLRRNELFLG